MPTYPSSLYKGSTRSGNGTTNDPGSYLWNNLTTYQELKDTVIGFGSGPNDSTTVTFNSAAKYPTDVRFGTTILSNPTDIVNDFNTVLLNFQAAGIAYTTAAYNMTALETTVAASFSGYAYNRLMRRIQYSTFEISRLASDITLVNTGTAGGATTAVSRYPSSQNRFTRTAGGA
jgi:hypothetical protein